MRITTIISAFILFLAFAGPTTPCQENPHREGQNENQEKIPDENGHTTPRADNSGKNHGDRPGDGSAPPRIPVKPMDVEISNSQTLNFEILSDPTPLPQGGEAKLIIKVNLQDNTFLTRGMSDTMVNLPPKAGDLQLGEVIWPKPSGNYTHSDRGSSVVGWTGMFFIEIPVQIAPDAKLGEFNLPLTINYKLMSIKGPKQSGAPLVARANVPLKIGLPRPPIFFPNKGGTKSTDRSGKKGPINPTLKENPANQSGNNNTRGILKSNTGGNQGEDPASGAGLPMEEGDGDTLFSDPIMVFGLAGVLLVGALLIMFRKR